MNSVCGLLGSNLNGNFVRFTFILILLNQRDEFFLNHSEEDSFSEAQRRKRSKKEGHTSCLAFVLIDHNERCILCWLLLFLQRAEDETARLYEEFLESFQGEDLPGSKAFVRGGLINPNEKVKADSEGQHHEFKKSIPNIQYNFEHQLVQTLLVSFVLWRCFTLYFGYINKSMGLLSFTNGRWKFQRWCIWFKEGKQVNERIQIIHVIMLH